jgi:plastocyanin
MKKFLFYILLILVALWATQSYTGFKVIDLAQNYLDGLDQPYLKYVVSFLGWMKDIEIPEVINFKSQVTPDPERTLNIFIREGGFVPNKNELLSGARVTWTNEDTKNHSVSGDNWGSQELKPGESFSKLFETTGTHKYYCSLHPSETGEITIR